MTVMKNLCDSSISTTSLTRSAGIPWYGHPATSLACVPEAKARASSSGKTRPQRRTSSQSNRGLHDCRHLICWIHQRMMMTKTQNRGLAL
jgi:hypothetical protein